MHQKQEDGNLKADLDINKLFKAQGFRWKQVINDVSGWRAQVMQLNKADPAVFRNPYMIEEEQEPLTAKAGVLLGLQEESDIPPASHAN